MVSLAAGVSAERGRMFDLERSVVARVGSCLRRNDGGAQE